MNDSSPTAPAADPETIDALLFPASFAQQRLWFLHKLLPDSPVYNIALARLLEGPLDRNALQLSIDQLVERHETLRTRFTTDNDEPMQVVSPAEQIAINFSTLHDTGQDSLRSHINQLATQPFDLEREPLLRVNVLHKDDQHLLVMVIHHIIADAWSLDILFRELVVSYNANCEGVSADLPELPIQYGDYADWQLEQADDNAQRQQLHYWREQLRDAPDLLDLPTDRPRLNLQSYAGDTLYAELPEKLAEDIRELAKQSGSTFFVVMLAAYGALMSRYAASNDLVIGTPMSGRDREEVAGVIGLFLNTLALRLDLEGNPGFTEIIQRARKTAFDGFAHPDVPFEKLVDELQPGRNMSHSPIFQTMLVVHQSDDAQAVEFQNISSRNIPFETHTAKFDLTLFVTESSAGTSIIFEYNTDLFDHQTIERMLGHFQTLLAAVVANPDAPLDEVSLLDGDERRQLLEDFNSSELDYGEPVPVGRLVEAQVVTTPDACAVRLGDKALSYTQLNAQANRLARELERLGAVPGTRVAICCPRDIGLAVAALACVKSGACYVPVDPAYPAERIQAMLADAEPVVILSHASVELPDLPEQTTAASVIRLDQFDFDGAGDSNSNTAHDNLSTGPGINDPLYCIYTSGSTGKPKGVQLSQQGLANLIRWQQHHERLAPAAKTLQFASFSFDVGFQELFTTWCSGGELVMISEDQRQDLGALADFIAAEHVERLYLPFAALQPLAEAWESSRVELSLRDIVVAGEQLKVTPAVRALFKRLDHAALHNQYGPSETHVVTALTLTGDSADWPTLPSIGTPVANTRCYVLDAHRQPVPIGLPGELYLGGIQVALGYLERPVLDAEKFLASPFIAGDRLYRTGDRVRYLADGQLAFLGRVDEQFKWRGFRIEPGEIEAALTADASVEDAVVIIRADTGADDKRLVAYVTPTANATIDTAQLAQALKDSLPDYMQPSIIVALDSLPLTPSGKVARRALPVPDYSQAQTAPFVAARTPTEAALVDLWQQVLKLDSVSIHADFFQLGGHSLLATQLIARIRQTLGIEAPLMTLFSNPTIAEFSSALDELRGIAGPPAISVAVRSDNLPLSFAQQRLWFLDQLEPGNPVYNFPIVLQLRGELDIDAMQAALDQLVARHESLRTSFTTLDNQPVQIILPSAAMRIEQVDAQAMPTKDCQTLINQLAQTGFDLNKAPLLRAHLLHTADHAWTLVLVTHHIVSDGWSLGVLLEELSALYTAASSGTQPMLADLPIQYVDYALWQRDWLADKELARQIEYWRELLDDAPDVLDIPTDWPRPSEQTFRGTGELRQLPATLQQSLHELARQHGCTLYMVLMAAFDVLLARYAATDDVVVGSPIAGRRMQETEGLIGYFANTLALRNDLSGDPDVAELLQRTRKMTLDAYNNQDAPFEKLVEELKPERNLSHAPIFQVMLVLQNNPEQNIEFGDLEYAYPDFEMGIAKFDLLLEITESRDGLRAGMQYNSDLFKSSTIERMLGHLELLLEAIVDNPTAKLSALPLLSSEERELVVSQFNDTDFDYGPDTCVHHLAEAQTERTPDAIALNFYGDKLNYRELNRRANVLAEHLSSLGAAPGTIVAISCERSIELPIAALAVLKSGACYTPVDPAYPMERIQAMLNDCAAPIVISQSTIELPPVTGQVVLLDQFDFTGDSGNPDSAVTPSDALYCIYTSGSTGTPKGVQLSHAGLSNLLRWQMHHERLHKPARTLQFASFSFDVSFQEIFSTWSLGGELVMINEELRQDLSALAEFIDAEKIERLYLPFAAFQPIAARFAKDNTRDNGTAAPSIKDIVVAGEQLQVSDEVRSLFAWLNDAALHNQYGPSETHVVTALTLTGDPTRWPALPSIGMPVANTQCYVLDQQQNPLPIGLPGELFLGGRQLALGYLNRPEQNQQKFLRSPFALGERLYRTGDRVRWLHNGELEFLGRVDEQIKWRGFRIEPGEIEAALTSLPQVNNCAVILREDIPDDKRLVAYVTAADAEAPESEDLRLQLKQTLPDYMLPSLIVVLEDFPLTPSGKVARRKLPAPDYSRDADAPIVEPRNPTEATLVDLWKSVLGLTEVSVHDDFFALGGHSLLATQLIARVRDEFSFALPLKFIFRYPSPAALGKTIEALQATAAINESAADDKDYEEISI